MRFLLIMAPGLYKSLNNLAVHTEIIGYLHRFLDQVSLNSLVPDILHRQEYRQVHAFCNCIEVSNNRLYSYNELVIKVHLGHIQDLPLLVASVYSSPSPFSRTKVFTHPELNLVKCPKRVIFLQLQMLAGELLS